MGGCVMERNLHSSQAGSRKGRPSSSVRPSSEWGGGVGGGVGEGALQRGPSEQHSPSSWLRAQPAGNLMFLSRDEAGVGLWS